MYQHPWFQAAVAVLIFTCFVFNVAQTELQFLSPPARGSDLDKAMASLEIFFTVAFALELALNFASNFLRPFLRDPWSLFDTIVIALSAAAIADDGLPGVAALRLVRTLRRAKDPSSSP